MVFQIVAFNNENLRLLYFLLLLKKDFQTVSEHLDKMNLGLFVIDTYSFQALEAGGCTNQAPSQGFHFIDVMRGLLIMISRRGCCFRYNWKLILHSPGQDPLPHLPQTRRTSGVSNNNLLHSFNLLLKTMLLSLLKILLLSLLKILLLSLLKILLLSLLKMFVVDSPPKSFHPI